MTSHGRSNVSSAIAWPGLEAQSGRFTEVKLEIYPSKQFKHILFL